MFRNALACAGWNLYALRKNPRFYMCAALGVLLSWLLTDKTMAISRTYLTNVEILEPFVWCYADADSILYASLVLLFLLSCYPRMDAAASYLIFRAQRSAWLLGQVMTIFALTFGYCLLILFSSMAICTGGNVVMENRWSDTAVMLSFSPASFEAALPVVRKTVKLTTPYGCAIQIFFLLNQYILLLSMLQLALTILKGRRAGICAVTAVSFIGLALSPSRFMAWLRLPQELQYYANLASAWLSPLQHATYTMHSFGYDLLPRLWVSYAIFGGLTMALIALAMFSVKRFSFDFSGGYADEQ